MKLAILMVAAVCGWAQEASLQGTISDPSGASVPGASVELRGPRDRRVKTDTAGRYRFPALAAGTYQLRITARGFATAQRTGLAIAGAAVFDAQLVIGTRAQVINVEGELRSVSADPGANASAIVIGQRQIAALSDDPDELALQLQALAGPAPGPDGGQVYVDGFSGGSLPAKSAIREVRVNSNPFAAEYDRPGFAHIDVLTKPGSEAFHGQAFAQIGDRVLNSRNPLLAQAERPPYDARTFGLNASGPLRSNKASFVFDGERRRIGEDAYILATTPEGAVNQAVATPQTRLSLRPGVDYMLNARNTLVARYQYIGSEFDNQGVGDFNLPSRAYNERQGEQTVQITETAMASARAVNETRLQYLRATSDDRAGIAAPAIDVVAAFTAGGASVGNSGRRANNWEASNFTTVARGGHTWKWGGRLRHSGLSDRSEQNFAGTFTFYTIDDYRAGRAAIFTRNSGTAVTEIGQTDAGLFFNDDWKVRRNVTLSYGVRYEGQTNRGGVADIAPRLGIAWGIGKKTVVRAGAGTFYDRVPQSVTLNADRFNGVTQQSYFILNPTFFPEIPTLAGGPPQQTRPAVVDLRSARLYQTSTGIEQQVGNGSKISLTWIHSRGVHLLNVRDVTPLTLLTESSGVSRQNQVVANANVVYRKATLTGYYALSYGRDDNEGLPADPNDLRAEWGPSRFGDIRHRGFLMSSLPVRWGFAVSPFFVVNSGVPYNITTGLDPFGTARPEGMEHNAARGPAAVNLGLRVAHTWRAVTFSASSLNALNHPNYAPPNGNLSSPYFGQYRTLGGLIVMNHGGGASAYNRKIDLQVRVNF